MGDLGCCLSEEFDPLATKFPTTDRQSGDVPTGPSEALDESSLYDVARSPHDDGNRRRHLSCRHRGLRTRHDDHVDLQPDEFSRQLWERSHGSVRGSVLDREVLAFHISELTKP